MVNLNDVCPDILIQNKKRESPKRLTQIVVHRIKRQDEWTYVETNIMYN